MTARFPSGTRGFGKTAVRGRRRVPFPPARITARTFRVSSLRISVRLDHVAAVDVVLPMIFDVLESRKQPVVKADYRFPVHQLFGEAIVAN